MIAKCSVDGCEKRVLARGLCSTHYEQDRWQRKKAAAAGEIPQDAPRRSSSVAQGADRVTINNGISREMYLGVRDTAEELAMPIAQLKTIASHLGVGHCRAKSGPCYYTARDIAKIRRLQEFMTELEIPAAVAVRLQKRMVRLKEEREQRAGEVAA